MGTTEHAVPTDEFLRHYVGGNSVSVLMTDAYKFAMGQVGDPLATEVFTLSMRKGGALFNPLDLSAVVRALVPNSPTALEEGFLQEQGFGLSEAMKSALRGSVEVWSAPPGAWIYEGEPVLRLSGPSFLLSWLEPLIIGLHFPMQIAAALLRSHSTHLACTCDDEAAIVRLVARALGSEQDLRIEVRPDDYQAEVRRRARTVFSMTERVAEVGMRGATCAQMHRLALVALAESGLRATSSVLGAQKLGLQPVGTCGHEHQMRFGSDVAGFRALRDGREQPPTYLFDTWNALEVGIPAVAQVCTETPDREFAVRFDSGDAERQVRALLSRSIECPFVFMDGMNAEKIANLGQLKERIAPSLPPWSFGIGSYFVGGASPNPYQRDAVSAVYKLSESKGLAVMKFSVPGKESLPGRPEVWRRRDPRATHLATGIVTQVGELASNDYLSLANAPRTLRPLEGPHFQLSKHTQAMKEDLQRQWMAAARPERMKSL